MNKKCRQYIGLTMAVLMYYFIHEGAHLVVALAQGVFITRWVGGGDMNGIVLLLSESMVSIVASVIAIVNSILVWKVLYPNYKKAFHNVD